HSEGDVGILPHLGRKSDQFHRFTAAGRSNASTSNRPPRKVPQRRTSPEFTRCTTFATTSASEVVDAVMAVTRSSNVLSRAIVALLCLWGLASPMPFQTRGLRGGHRPGFIHVPAAHRVAMKRSGQSG